MRLGDLLKLARCKYKNHDRDRIEVQRLTADSRTCQPGDLFIGMPGANVDGGQYAEQALEKGAIAAIVSAKTDLPSNIAGVIFVNDVVEACADIATAFYDYPAEKMKLVGVTGTNGKTTTTHLIEFLLHPEYPTALFGTLYARWQGYTSTATHTTPFAIDLQAQLRQALDSGCQVSIMEVSSHALDQKRVLGCPFEVSVFTNLTQDHLDYHPTLEDYFQAKALLFNRNYLKGRAIINLDDPYGRRLAEITPHEWTYSLHNSEADFYTENLAYSPDGVKGTLYTPFGHIALSSPLVGSFNVSNVLAAIATAVHLGIGLDEIAERLHDFKNVPGRVEQVKIGSEQDITVVVDYAHTPDSLENLLTAMRPFTARELVCVFGCGGDRDRTKRPLMGEIAARLANQVFVTSDNPRTEEPQIILADILAGIPASVKPVVEADRRNCIQLAIAQAQPGDTVLIAGKGHEDYQILGKTKIHFDDREEAIAALQQKYGLT
jgi:UDP-N-acetylmuramoyl-L-alanyl-D-glutamate--2,6-diaminopimelate ligase